MSNFKIAFLVVLFSLEVFVVNAQSDYRKGYVISKENDTMFGQIDYRGSSYLTHKCKFKKDLDNTKTVFVPADIYGFRFVDGKYYKSLVIDNERLFVEVLVEGNMNLYCITNTFGSRFFVEKEDLGLKEVEYKSGTKYINGAEYSVNSKSYIGLLKVYTKDAPIVNAKVASIGEPDFTSLVTLVRDYNLEVSTKEACTVYQDLRPKLAVNVELNGGVLSVNGFTNYDPAYRPQVSLFFNFALPRKNERLYIRTGFQYTVLHSLVSDSLYYHYWRVPIQIAYATSRGKVRPHLAYGLSFMPNLSPCVVLSGGVSFRISKKIYFNLSTDVEFLSEYLIVPQAYLSHSFNGGLTFYFND